MASKTTSNIPTSELQGLNPAFSVDHLIKLKLAKEISLVSEAFKEAIVNIEVEEKFLAELEAKKLKVSCLKKDSENKRRTK
ncbi:hypothetical protein Ahy_A05g024970 isoform B [Arachis hypogaea]|uniref:Uncharacterized protein n=1 Tax=Arachis hypogaea TaxID=3818 RepID=A0A445D790_ARAHY|nr:hypothetical protein Ahy_A05g024970 isoform B [Arachis hypogaea]